jgi:hypothetical protein
VSAIGKGSGRGGLGGDEMSLGNSAEKISGSSVATAVAAGVASLCLACYQIDRVEVSPQNRGRIVRKKFDEAKENKYVHPWVLFGETRRGDGELMFLKP